MSLPRMILFLAGAFAPLATFALILPPSQKLKMGMGEQLKDECEDLAYDYDLSFFYAEGISDGHSVGKHLFTSLTECTATMGEGGRGGLMFYPEYENYEGALEKVSATLEQCKDLTGMSCTLTHWPDTPATCLRFEAMPDIPLYDREGDDDIEVRCTRHAHGGAPNHPNPNPFPVSSRRSQRSWTQSAMSTIPCLVSASAPSQSP